MNRLTATITLALLGFAASPLSAEQFGLFTYSVHGDTVAITDYPEDATGEVVIPSEIDGKTVTSINSYAFSGCSSLTSITIPNSPTAIDWNAFQGCTGLTSIHVDEDNPRYSSLEGVLFDKDRTTVFQYPLGKGATSYAIPEGVTRIGDDAFSGCTKLTSVLIPSTVTSIDTTPPPFDDCTKLTSIEVDPQNPIYSSQHGVLYAWQPGYFLGPQGPYRPLVLIRCPEGKSGAFLVPDGVGSIGTISSNAISAPSNHTHYHAFSGCSGLTSITIPASVYTLNTSSFSGCTNLRAIIFLGNSPTVWTTYGSSESSFPSIAILAPPPMPILSDEMLSIRFDPGFRSFGWRVETSTDLVDWTTEGVTLTEPEAAANGQRVTASVPRDNPARFLRLVPYITSRAGGSSIGIGG